MLALVPPLFGVTGKVVAPFLALISSANFPHFVDLKVYICGLRALG